MSNGEWMLIIDNLLLEQGHEINKYFADRLEKAGVDLDFAASYLSHVAEKLEIGSAFLKNK